MHKRVGSLVLLVSVELECICVSSSVPRRAQRAQVVVRRRPSDFRFLMNSLSLCCV
jgi:hypothetical protein